MITFSASLWLSTGDNAHWHFVTVPEEESGELKAHSIEGRRGFGAVKVEAEIDCASTSSGQAVRWRTSVFPQKSGGFILPVKKEVRCRAGIAAGDDVTVRLNLVFVG